MNKTLISFSYVYQISDSIKDNEILNLSEVVQADEYVFDFAERLTFRSLSEVFEWIKNNELYIRSLKMLDCCELMLDKDYFEQRCISKDKWFVKRDVDAILIGANVNNSVKVKTDNYDNYKQDIMNKIFEK